MRLRLLKYSVISFICSAFSLGLRLRWLVRRGWGAGWSVVAWSAAVELPLPAGKMQHSMWPVNNTEQQEHVIAVLLAVDAMLQEIW